MQTSKDMNPRASCANGIQRYQTGFVLVLTLMFLFIMLMSGTPQGLPNFEHGFFQRNLLIENFNRVRLKLGDRVLNHVLIGDHGWMELAGIKNLDDYQNAIHFSTGDLERLASAIQACYQYAAEHHMTFLVVVAPNKASIYPDKLPREIQPLSDMSRPDQLNDYLKAQGIPGVVDLRPALREARQQHDVYYKFGTHWNEYGAYIAYETIIKTLSQKHSDLVPYSFKFFRFRSSSIPDKSFRDVDIARLIQANYVLLEPTLRSARDPEDFFYKIASSGSETIPGYHEVTWIPNSALPSLLFYHDSFGNIWLNDFLALNFSQAFYVRRFASGVIHRESIERFSPDIVLYQIVERNLDLMQSQLAGCAEE